MGRECGAPDPLDVGISKQDWAFPCFCRPFLAFFAFLGPFFAKIDRSRSKIAFFHESRAFSMGSCKYDTSGSPLPV